MVCNFWVILWIKLVLTFKGEGRGQPSLKQYIFSYFEVVSVNKPGRSVYFNKTNLGWLKDLGWLLSFCICSQDFSPVHSQTDRLFLS